MQKQKSRYFHLLIFLACFSYGMQGQINLTVIGNWNFTIPTSDLSEAGMDFSGTYSSNSNEVLIDITQQGFIANFFNYQWRVDVRKADVDWHTNLQLYARRTGNGSPFFFNGNVTGGTNYQQITNSDQSFFSGNRTRFDIPIQYEIRNVSVLIPAKSYETTIIYTVTDL